MSKFVLTHHLIMMYALRAFSAVLMFVVSVVTVFYILSFFYEMPGYKPWWLGLVLLFQFLVGITLWKISTSQIVKAKAKLR